MKQRAGTLSIVTDEDSAQAGSFALQSGMGRNDPGDNPGAAGYAMDAIYSRRLWILAFALVSVAAAWGVSQALPPVYEATATLEVERPPIGDVVRELKSDALLRPVIDKFHLTESDRSRLTISAPSEPLRIRITYRDTDPETAAAVANWVAKSYVERPRTWTGSADPQLAGLRAKRDQSQRALLDFEHKHGADPDAEMNKLAARLLNLNIEYSKAQANREAKQAALQSLEPNSPEAAAAAVPALREAERREAELNETYLRTKAEADVLPARAAQYQRLRQRAETDRKLYDDISRTVEQARSEARRIPVHIGSAAVPATHPSTPNTPLNCAAALLASLLVGCAGAILLQQRNSKLRTPKQIRSAAGRPDPISLPAVNSWRDRPAVGIFAGDTLDSAPGDAALTRLREKIRVLCVDLGNRQERAIAVVSPCPREGRSRIAFELASAIASEGRRTLLVDGNLRAPVLPGAAASPRRGLSGALAGETKWRDTIQRGLGSGAPDILAFGGPPDGNWTDAMYERFSILMREAMAVYDTVVLDSPPFLRCAESLAIADAAGVAVAVARAGSTSSSDFEAVLSYLQRLGVPVGAIVLNDVPRSE